MNLQVLSPYICLFVGIGILILGIVIRRKLQNSELWPKTTGLILESTIEDGWVNVGGGRARVVRPKVTYEYQVDGKKFTSSQLALVENNSADENVARGKSEKYSVGQQVVVLLQYSKIKIFCFRNRRSDWRHIAIRNYYFRGGGGDFRNFLASSNS
jgi:hypothetical protein